jgi:LacI family gluconate utilization system Gnt-I transcriptional repressor
MLMHLPASAQPMAAKKARRGHGRPTLHDVAELAGVTRITVSRFLRSPDLLAPETAERVRLAVESVGYVPNLQAGQLASGRSRIVATLIPNAGHSVFAETVQGLAEGLRDSGYEMLLTSTGYQPQREERQLRAVLGWSPAAIVVTGLHRTTAAQQLLLDARAAGTPVVEIWDHPTRHTKHRQLVQVGFDHHAAGQMMARHLIGLGHKRLAYVDSGVIEDVRAHLRRDGFVDQARQRGVKAVVLTAPSGEALDGGAIILNQLLGLRLRVTAAAFANDNLATGALLQAQAQGIAVPKRLALLGFGDFPISRHVHPGLSTVHTPTAEIGRIAAATVLQWMAAPEQPANTALDCTLIVRGSTHEGLKAAACA